MKLVLDQGVPRMAAVLLRRAGVEAVHVEELGMWESEDADIMVYAAENDGVVVTHDSDFHALLASQRASNPSVIRLRDPKLRHEVIAPILAALVRTHADQLREGVAVSIIGTKVLTRKLPFFSE